MSVTRNWRSFPTNADESAGTARGRRAACLLTCVLLGPVGGRAFAGAQVETPIAGDLKQLSIEDLMNLEATSTAAQKTSPPRAAPVCRAAIFWAAGSMQHRAGRR
jgi:hypothetical protein